MPPLNRRVSTAFLSMGGTASSGLQWNRAGLLKAGDAAAYIRSPAHEGRCLLPSRFSAHSRIGGGGARKARVRPVEASIAMICWDRWRQPK